MKFEKRWEIAEVVAPFLAQAIELHSRNGQEIAVDALVPVPLHWMRSWSRGFDQAEELACGVGRISGWPVQRSLARLRRTGEQSQTQSVAARMENMRGAFACVDSTGLAGKTVWLVDDVCTTGATLHAAATALRELPRKQRPKAIHAAVLCVTDVVGVPEFKPS